MKYQTRMSRAFLGRAVAPGALREAELLAGQADGEIITLREELAGQREVFTRWIRDALVTLDSVDPDDLPDAEHLQRLIASGERLLKP